MLARFPAYVPMLQDTPIQTYAVKPDAASVLFTMYQIPWTIGASGTYWYSYQVVYPAITNVSSGRENFTVTCPTAGNIRLMVQVASRYA